MAGAEQVELTWSDAAQSWLADVELEYSKHGHALGPAGPAGVIRVSSEHLAFGFDTITGRLSFVAFDHPHDELNDLDEELVALVIDRSLPAIRPPEPLKLSVRRLPDIAHRFLVARQFVNGWDSYLSAHQRVICRLSVADLALLAADHVPSTLVDQAVAIANEVVGRFEHQHQQIYIEAGANRAARLSAALGDMAERFAEHRRLRDEARFLATIQQPLGSRVIAPATTTPLTTADVAAQVVVERSSLDDAGEIVLGGELVRRLRWTEPTAGWHRVHLDIGSSVSITDRLTVSGLTEDQATVAIAEAHGQPDDRVAMLAVPPGTGVTSITVGDGPIVIDDHDVTSRIANANRRARLGWIARNVATQFESDRPASGELFTRATLDWLAAGFAFRAGWCYAWSDHEAVGADLDPYGWLTTSLANVRSVMPDDIPIWLDAWMLMIDPLELEAAACE